MHKNHASLQRSKDLPIKGLREKTNTKISKNKTFSPNVLKEEKKKHNFWPLTKFLWKRILSIKQNMSYDMKLKKNIFWRKRNRMEPLNDENKLQDDEKNKNWKVQKFLRTNIIVNFNTICYKLSSLRNKIQSILN